MASLAGLSWRRVQTNSISPEYKKKILDMYNNLYQSVGTIDYTVDSIIGKYPYAWIGETTGQQIENPINLKSVILYWKSNYGNKIGLCISETPQITKDHGFPKIFELLENRQNDPNENYYVEVSHAPEKIFLKNKLEPITEPNILRTLLGNNIQVLNENELKYYSTPSKDGLSTQYAPLGSYFRKIEGLDEPPVRKTLYGKYNIMKGGKNKKYGKINGKIKKTLKKRNKN